MTRLVSSVTEHDRALKLAGVGRRVFVVTCTGGIPRLYQIKKLLPGVYWGQSEKRRAFFVSLFPALHHN